MLRRALYVFFFAIIFSSTAFARITVEYSAVPVLSEHPVDSSLRTSRLQLLEQNGTSMTSASASLNAGYSKFPSSNVVCYAEGPLLINGVNRWIAHCASGSLFYDYVYRLSSDPPGLFVYFAKAHECPEGSSWNAFQQQCTPPPCSDVAGDTLTWYPSTSGSLAATYCHPMAAGAYQDKPNHSCWTNCGTCIWGDGSTDGSACCAISSNQCALGQDPVPEDPKDHYEESRDPNPPQSQDDCPDGTYFGTVNGVTDCYGNGQGGYNNGPKKPIQSEDAPAPVEGWDGSGKPPTPGTGGGTGGGSGPGSGSGIGPGDLRGDCDPEQGPCYGGEGSGMGEHTSGTCTDYEQCTGAFYGRIGNAPIVQGIGGMSGIIGSGGNCPPLSIDLSSMGWGTISTSIHCDLSNQIAPIISVVMMIFWTITAIRIFASS